MIVLRLREALLALATAAAAAAAGSLLGGRQADLYRTLRLPSFAPPGIVFPIVWSILYLLLACSAYLVLAARDADPTAKRRGLFFHFTGLALTALWPLLFFRLTWFTAAFFLILAMIAVGVVTTLCFSKLSRPAALLYLPYLVWIIFALALNYAVIRLNP